MASISRLTGFTIRTDVHQQPTGPVAADFITADDLVSVGGDRLIIPFTRRHYQYVPITSVNAFTEQVYGDIVSIWIVLPRDHVSGSSRSGNPEPGDLLRVQFVFFEGPDTLSLLVIAKRSPGWDAVSP
jgi:hypothetical protein